MYTEILTAVKVFIDVVGTVIDSAIMRLPSLLIWLRDVDCLLGFSVPLGC